MVKRLGAKVRLLLAGAVAALTAAILPASIVGSARILCLWDAGMLCFLGLTWLVMLTATPETMRRNAQRQDQGRTVILVLITAAACASLLAIGFMLQEGKTTLSPPVLLHVTLAIVTIVGSWLLVHTIFALHYAQGYYRPHPHRTTGLDFPSDTEPDYWDFLYFSFVIGLTSQVSDVAVKTRSLRRLALIHGVLSFFFNTAILAMSINIIAGLI